ncbi:MAG TPA: SDR family oxidoreductase [Vicinamibacterales bacterium]|nr:SDR family oxidoreductase [Vicinamibacterales bacterium]
MSGGNGNGNRHRNGNGARSPQRVEPIAIVGMRGRFPGASDLETYWRNLADGVESIETLSQDDMRAAGVPDHISRLPGYVNASPALDRIDEFDAEFFGFSARDASLTDPQHRLFLETCWEALEDAGYDPARFPGAIGLFGGCELSGYLYQLFQNRDSLQYLDGMTLIVTNDKDHLCTQASYRLDLRGPSVVVQTTCSTSLVAVSLACDSLHSGRCDMALAGGVTVRVPQRGGYFYTAGSILSPDGHCRPFDANAQGTIVGSGVGLVVLRRLSDALADGDTVRAVILGAGLNNDGSDKVGYTAPSFRGQAAAIRAAHAIAGVSPESIGYVEAHGTGTILGDPIEFAALNDAFRAGTNRRGYCGIGSVKSNFGHLSCAAGVAGLIKTVLVLEHGAIPPTVHYQTPNPAIDFASSPFYVTTRLHPWERNGTPRRAGVSSFGVGGTNAHLVVEEAPARPAPTQRRSHQLLVLSARSQAALDHATARLASHLRAHPDLDLADVAFTLHVGRRTFRHRRALVAASDDLDGFVTACLQPERMAASVAAADRPVVFMFPGQGSQYPGMAAGLYKTEPVVRRAIDRCARILEPELGADLRKLLFPPQRRRAQVAEELRDTRWAQPALFVVGYALAELWSSWGVRPAAMIGHSVGEYVAATLAGVMTLEDALRLIARRGQLISALPRGSMLAVMAPAEALEHYVGADVSLAAMNAPGYSVLSGPDRLIDDVEAALGRESVAARRLYTSHAFHSAMMDPILGEFEELVARVPLSAPVVPFAATLTGDWANGDVTQPRYWSAQLRSTVRFADAVRAVVQKKAPAGKDSIFLEIGPGNTLVTFAAETARGEGSVSPCLVSLPRPQDLRSDTEVMLSSLGQLWASGATVDWEGFHRTERRARVSLPTYPFERQSYWIGSRPGEAAPTLQHENRDTTDWFHRAVWRDVALVAAKTDALTGRRILVFDEQTGLGTAVVDCLRAAGSQPILVRQGRAFTRIGDSEYTLDPSNADGFTRLAHAVCVASNRLAGVIDCWTAAPPGATDLDAAARVTLLGPLRFAHALSSQPTLRPLPMLLVARGAARVHHDDALDPPRAFGAGLAKVLPQEHTGLRVAHVDVDADSRVAGMLVAELAAGASEPTVALRAGQRFVETFEPMPIRAIDAPLDLPERPVVMVTGGLGHMGMGLSEGLFDHAQARLVLLGRTALPEPDQWAARSEDAALSSERRTLLKRLARLHEQRPDVFVVNADMNDAAQVEAAVDAAIERFGHIDLVIHGAARIDPAAFGSVADTGPEVVEAQFSPKLRGLLSLIKAFRGREPSRWVLHSSISTVLGGLGLAAYSAANAMLDAIALAGGDRWLSIDWDLWDNAGEAQAVSMPLAIYPPEGQDAFHRLLGAPVGSRVLVVASDLVGRLKAWVRHEETSTKGVAIDRHPRPNLATAYVEPRTTTERELADIWGDQLGIASIGIHDRFFDLGGHSLLAVQVASEIRDRFQVELPVLKLFQAPTVAELAVLVDQAQSGAVNEPPSAAVETKSVPAPTPLQGDAPTAAAKARHREFYDDVTRRLEQAGVGEASFFLNYGYVPQGDEDEAQFDVPDGVFNPSSIRLAFELIGRTDLSGRRVLDVGCGRGGTVALIADRFDADVTGVDLSPEAIAFCRRVHRHPRVRFEVGDAEHVPVDDRAFDVVTNVESSHTYPNLRAFFAEVSRVLVPGGIFLYTDLLPVQRWMEVRVLLGPRGFTITDDRHITLNVLASCDQVAATRAQAFGGSSAMIDNFLAVPGSAVYEQMRSGAWEYRILRAERA